MMGGHVFFMDDKMLCGTHIDKKLGDSLLMARIGKEAYERESTKGECLPMDFTRRSMRGYVFVTPARIDRGEDLDHWMRLCLEFNALSKSSKRKKSLRLPSY